MRDLSNQEKQDATRLQKQMEKLHNETNNLTKDKERMEQEIQQLQEQVLELKEQVSTQSSCYIVMKQTLNTNTSEISDKAIFVL